MGEDWRKNKYMESLFIALRKFSPNGNIDALENFITQAFAWLLKSSPEFSSFSLNKINEKLANKDILNTEQARWSTQVYWEGIYPDMICEIDKCVYVFEHKVRAQLHDDQLDNYRHYAKTNYHSYKLILITAEQDQWYQEPDLAMCWSDVYFYIKTWLDKPEGRDSQLDFIFDGFLALLKDVNLTLTLPISSEEILGYSHASDIQKEEIKEKSRELFETVIKYETSGIYDFSAENGFRPVVKEHRGRIGIDIFPEWWPGLFVGFLLDHERYKVNPINKEKGPDCCLMIDYESPFVNNYRCDGLYNKFVIELSQLFRNKERGWEFYNHLEQDIYENKWHPLYIRKPIVEVLAHSEDIKYHYCPVNF